MHHSSIFSSDTHQAQWRVARWIVYFAVFLLLAEALLRLPFVQAALPAPAPSLWHAPLVEDKVEYFRTFAASHDIDVLFVGNSTMQAGVDPAAFDADRTAQGAGGDSFNASIEGLPPSVNKEFLKMYLRYASPRTVVIGLTPQDLNAGSPWAKDMDDRAGHSINLQAGARDSLMGYVLAFLLDTLRTFSLPLCFASIAACAAETPHRTLTFTLTSVDFMPSSAVWPTFRRRKGCRRRIAPVC